MRFFFLFFFCLQQRVQVTTTGEEKTRLKPQTELKILSTVISKTL